jgi:hypothetical protein
MALEKGVNSYVTLSEADSYFEDRLDAAAWLSSYAELQEQALVTATRMLDEEQWQGSVVDANQALAFPRVGAFRDDSRGLRLAFTSTYVYSVNAETETSLNRDIRLIRQATYELAYHLMNNDGLLDSTGEITDIKVGPITLKEVKNAPSAPRTVRRVIKPMLRNSAKSWEGY